MGQTAVGVRVLIACFAGPPRIYILILIVIGRYLARARIGSARGLLLAATLMWLATSRIGASKKATVQDLRA